MSKNIIIMLGPAGSGKSTQAEILSKKYKLKHIIESTLLKKEAQKNTKIGKEIKKSIKKGDLVPFEISCKLLFNELEKTKNKNILIDGFPRQIEQASVLEYYIFEKKHILKTIIFININENNCIKRLIKRKRNDDTKKVIKERFKVYNKETKPVIQRYKKQNKVIKINGNKPITEVSNEILKKIKNKI